MADFRHRRVAVRKHLRNTDEHPVLKQADRAEPFPISLHGQSGFLLVKPVKLLK